MQKEKIFNISGAIFSLALIFIVLSPELRIQARSLIVPKDRIILAVAKSVLLEAGEELQVLKVKTDEGLFIEVYGQENKNNIVTQKLISSAQLPDKKDGYFTFNGQVTNLAIDDIDNDKTKEILVTSYDENLVAHLNVYKYVKGQKNLELVKLQ